MADKSPNKVAVKVELGQDFRRYHANGIFGGITPRGELEIYLIEDISPLPEGFTLSPVPGTRTMEEEVKAGQPTRLFNLSVTLPVSAIPSIIDWFQEKQRLAEESGLLPTSDVEAQVKQ